MATDAELLRDGRIREMERILKTIREVFDDISTRGLTMKPNTRRVEALKRSVDSFSLEIDKLLAGDRKMVMDRVRK